MNGMMTYGAVQAPPPLNGEVMGNEEPSPELENQDIVREVRECIEDSYLHDQTNRTEAETDLEFLSGNHWPANIRSIREAADKPVLTINRLPQFVRQITNDIRQADIAIKASPEDNETDVQLAEVYDAILRLIQYQSSAKHVYATAAEHQAGCGIGHFRIVTRYTDDETFDQELCIKAIANPLSVFWDPAAVMPDRSDAMWCAITETIPRKTFKRRYPGKAEASVDSPFSTSMSGLTWASQDDVMIAEYWCKKPYDKMVVQLVSGETVDAEKVAGIPGIEQQVAIDQSGQPRVRKVTCHKVMHYLVSGTEVLEGPHEWPGKYIPIVPVIGGEWPLQNKTYRYGAIRFARDPAQLLPTVLHEPLRLQLRLLQPELDLLLRVPLHLLHHLLCGDQRVVQRRFLLTQIEQLHLEPRGLLPGCLEFGPAGFQRGRHLIQKPIHFLSTVTPK